MTEQTWWLVGALATLIAAAIGFFVGRSFGGAKKRVDELEAEVARQKDEISGYKREVESHFDKTASLVASMAGSYKDLFEHLSSGYEKLSSGSTRDLFRERVTGLLLGSAGGAAVAASLPDGEEEMAAQGSSHELEAESTFEPASEETETIAATASKPDVATQPDESVAASDEALEKPHTGAGEAQAAHANAAPAPAQPEQRSEWDSRAEQEEAAPAEKTFGELYQDADTQAQPGEEKQR